MIDHRNLAHFACRTNHALATDIWSVDTTRAHKMVFIATESTVQLTIDIQRDAKSTVAMLRLTLSWLGGLLICGLVIKTPVGCRPVRTRPISRNMSSCQSLSPMKAKQAEEREDEFSSAVQIEGSLTYETPWDGDETIQTASKHLSWVQLRAYYERQTVNASGVKTSTRSQEIRADEYRKVSFSIIRQNQFWPYFDGMGNLF